MFKVKILSNEGETFWSRAFATFDEAVAWAERKLTGTDAYAIEEVA